MKKRLPKRRLCQDPQTKYCYGSKNSRTPWGHRGCCVCHEYNSDPEGTWSGSECNPYLLPEKLAELKKWWLDNDMGPWETDDRKGRGNYRPKMKRRGRK